MFLTLEEWAEATGGEVLAGDPSMYVGGNHPGGLSIDSRSIEKGQWFIALEGTTGRDGHEFIADAISAGAAGVIVSDSGAYETLVAKNNPNLPALLVKDTTLALGDAARSLLEKFKPFVIAITGTVGKTSVKENVAHVASTRWPTLKTLENWNTEIGLPLTVFEITPEHKVAVLEMAARGLGQINYLSMIARPDVAVITFVGAGHLSEFRSFENVLKAKWEIVDGLKNGGILVTHDDSDIEGHHEKVEEYRVTNKVVTYGMQETNDVHSGGWPSPAKRERNFTNFTITTHQGSTETRLHGVGPADIINALAATAIALQIKIDGPNGPESLTLNEIGNALRAVPPIPGRMETIVRPSGVEVIFDAYNSNPHSLSNALQSLHYRETLIDGSPINRKVAILGDMLELGEHADFQHRIAGTTFASCRIDVLLTVGELGSIIYESAKETESKSQDFLKDHINLLPENCDVSGDINGEIFGVPFEGTHYQTTEECAVDLKNRIKPGDLVLLKASRGLEFERLLEGDW